MVTDVLFFCGVFWSEELSGNPEAEGFLFDIVEGHTPSRMIVQSNTNGLHYNRIIYRLLEC